MQQLQMWRELRLQEREMQWSSKEIQQDKVRKLQQIIFKNTEWLGHHRPYRASIISNKIISYTSGSLWGIEIDSSDHSSSAHFKILPPQCAFEESSGTRAPLATTLRNLEAANTILWTGPVIEVVIGTKTGSRTNLKETFT